MNTRHLRIALAGAACAIAWRALAAPSPPERTLAGLAAMLGESSGQSVDPADVAWEPSRGVLGDSLLGRRVLFLGRASAGAPRDLFRARVRVTLEGRPLSVESVRDLSATQVADEGGLVVSGARAAYVTASFGRIEAATVLDLTPAPHPTARLLERLTAAITAWQETGALDGLGRTDLAFDTPSVGARVALDDRSLRVDLDTGRSVSLDLATSAPSGDVETTGARVIPTLPLRKQLVHWAVDAVRAEVGPEPILWLEQQVFAVRDVVRRAEWAVAGAPATPHEPRVAVEVIAAALPLDATRAADEGGTWPPAPIAPAPGVELQGEEGKWQPITLPWLKRLPHPAGTPEPPPYFYKTQVRPDPQRPYATVIVVAMDMRQLDLDMEAGVEDPKPLTGQRGAGKIPRDPKVLGRVVGAFNGAFKTTHGAYGMMVHRRVLLPPKADAATVLVTSDDRVGLGTWGRSTEVPADVVSYRQNLEPLVEDGKLSPSGRTQWGWQLAGTSMFTERSGICVTPAGNVYYAWGDEVSAATLGKAMILAGCTYGMHLDMNPHHTGFAFADVRSPSPRDYQAKLLTPQMEILPERYLEYSPKDFFYLMLHEATPPGDLGWAVDPGAQPAPAWSPAAWHATVATDGVQVELRAFDPGRWEARVRPGAKEPTRARDLPSGDLSGDDAHRALAAIGLGRAHGKDARPPGLVLDGRTAFPVQANAATLAIASGAVALLPPGVAPPAGADLVQLPMLLDDGKPLADAPDAPGMRLRGALGLDPAGRLVVATVTAPTNAPLATALAQAGCARAVLLDRGAHLASFLHRTGAGAPPVTRYDETVLYVLGKPLAPRGFRWTPQDAAGARPVAAGQN